MSREAVNEVYAFSRSTGTARLVLLVLADYANGDREAWPSVGSLAARANLPKRTVQRALRVLEDSHELEIATNGGGRNRTTRYRVVPRHGATQPTLDGFEEGRHSVTVSEGVNGDKTGVERVSNRAVKGVTGGTQVVEKKQKKNNHPLSPLKGASKDGDWDRVLEHLSGAVPPMTVNAFRANLSVVGHEGGTLTLAASDDTVAGWTRNTFLREIEAAAAQVFGADTVVELAKSETEKARERKEQEKQMKAEMRARRPPGRGKRRAWT